MRMFRCIQHRVFICIPSQQVGFRSAILDFENTFTRKDMHSWFPFDQRPSFVSYDAVVFSVNAGFPEVDVFLRYCRSVRGWKNLRGEGLSIMPGSFPPFSSLLTDAAGSSHGELGSSLCRGVLLHSNHLALVRGSESEDSCRRTFLSKPPPLNVDTIRSFCCVTWNCCVRAMRGFIESNIP